MHILVVDPNIAFGTLLSEELLRLGYSAERVDSGKQAIQSAQQTPPSLAILDMALKAPDALTLASELRTLDETIRLMLIPLIGENLEIGDHSVLIQGVLPKPFFLPELPERINAVLDLQAEAKVEDAIEVAEDLQEEIQAVPPVEVQTPRLDVGDDIFAPTPITLFEDRDHGFIYSRYLLSERRIRELLDDLIFEVGADGAVLTLDERMLMWVGEFTEAQADPIAKVVIQGWRSSEEMARILGREQLQFEQSIAGGSYMLYALSVDVNAILAVAIRGSATLGMIRHRAREVVIQIAELCSIL